MAVKELEIKPFSKKGYKSFKFEDIAFSISERVEPKQTDLEIYVGLEHIDANSIHIKRHGTPADVEGTKLKVYPGDLIFGKRRAYQRKAAIANFEGICSAHAMVLRANPKNIIPELFPFFIHSDQFMNRAIDISVGSLSPTINWGTIKTQEFVLPPLEQQAKLAELLWAGDELLAKYEEQKRKIEITKEALQNNYFKREELAPKIVSTDFFDSVKDGTHDTPQKQSIGFKLLTSKNIKENILTFETDYFINEDDYNDVNKRSGVNLNDILFGMIGTVGQVCRIIEPPEFAIKNMGLFKTNDEQKSLIGYHYFRSKQFQNELLQNLSGTTQKYASLSYLRSIKLPDPSNEIVKSWMNKEEEFDKALINFNLNTELIKQIQNQLINQIFSSQ